MVLEVCGIKPIFHITIVQEIVISKEEILDIYEYKLGGN